MVVSAAARKVHVSLNVRYEADSFLVLKELTEYGLGYTTLPLSAASREIEAGRLRYAPLCEPPVIRQLVLGAARDDRLSRAARIVVRLAREEIKQMAESGEWKVQLQY
jgi:LysR family transcriptional regulator, nitrogen assimilation regulatory protein